MTEIRPSIRLLIPNKSCGMLIGKKGTGLRRLHTAYNVEVKVEQEPFLETGERLVTLHKRWPGNGLLAVCNVVAEDLKGQPDTQLVIQMLVPDSAAGAVVGSKGAELKNVFASSGTYVSMQRDSVGPSGERLVGFKGPNAESVALAIDLVAEKAESSKKRGRVEGDNGPRKRPMTGDSPKWEPQFLSRTSDPDFAPLMIRHDSFHRDGPQHANNQNLDSFHHSGHQRYSNDRNFDAHHHSGPYHSARSFDSFHSDNRTFESFRHSEPHHSENRNLQVPPQRDIFPLESVEMAPDGSSWSARPAQPFERLHMRHDLRFGQPFETPLHQTQGQPLMGVPRRNIQGGEDVPLCLLVNHDSAGEIIGKKGSGFKRFREQFGANVKVTNDPAFTGLGRSVEISGEPSSQDAAARAILDMACMTVDGKSMARLLFPSSKAGAVIGKGGAGLTAVRTSTGAYVKIDREEIFGERVATVSGSDAAAVGAAVCLLAAALRRAKGHSTRPQ